MSENGQVIIHEFEIRDNQLVSPDHALLRDYPNGFSAPYFIRNTQWSKIINPPNELSAANGNEILFPINTDASPMSALGIAEDGAIVRISLVGNIEHPQDPQWFPTRRDLENVIRKYKIKNALYTGASADVQYFDRLSATLIEGRERPKAEEKRWLLKPGQSTRGLPIIGKLTRRST